MRTVSITFAESIDGFKCYLIQQNRSIKTIKSYTQDLRYFEQWINRNYDNTVCINSITKTDIRDFEREIKANQAISPATINRKLVALRKWTTYLFENETLPLNIGEDISIKKVQKQNTIRWLTRQEVGQLLHAVELTKHKNFQKGPLHQTLIILLVNLGLRIEEACNLGKNSIDEQNNIIHINGKGDKHRIIPQTEKTKVLIQTWLNSRENDSEYILVSSKSNQMSTRAAQHILKNYSKQIGIEITPHSLRHTYCKQLANSGVDIQTIAQLAGHNSVDTTRIYVTPSIRELQNALRKTEF